MNKRSYSTKVETCDMCQQLSLRLNLRWFYFWWMLNHRMVYFLVLFFVGVFSCRNCHFYQKSYVRLYLHNTRLNKTSYMYNYITSVFHWNVTIWLVMKWSHDYKSDVSYPNETQIRTCTCLHDDVRCKQSMA
jgi:hypothetical protein